MCLALDVMKTEQAGTLLGCGIRVQPSSKWLFSGHLSCPWITLCSVFDPKWAKQLNLWVPVTESILRGLSVYISASSSCIKLCLEFPVSEISFCAYNGVKGFQNWAHIIWKPMSSIFLITIQIYFTCGGRKKKHHWWEPKLSTQFSGTRLFPDM